MAIFAVLPRAADLYTTVRNTAGVERYYAFLGARGMRLGVNEEVTLFGHPTEWGTRKDWDGRSSRGLANALHGNGTTAYLSIVSTPAIYLKDGTTNAVKKLSLAGGVLGTADPSWGAFTAN